MSEDTNLYRRATLKALETRDGFWRVKSDRAKVGHVYTVDLSTIREVEFFNMPHQKHFTCEVVDVLDEEYKTWDNYPTELLEFDRS